MEQKKLPIGIQHYPNIIEGGFTYVDKTEYCHRLISRGNYYFLSRPRRFGKSLLVSTLQAIFEGRKDLFAGTWIHDKLDWEPRPVILLDFSRITKRAPSLEEGLSLELEDIAGRNGLSLLSTTHVGKFQELIERLGQERKVAILVDEYDKPLIDNIERDTVVNAHRQVLKDFYSIIKGNDPYIAFLLLTGVTKFSQVSIFSDLNNLQDITLSGDYAQMLGYTQAEILRFFPTYLAQLEEKMAGRGGDILTAMKDWYDGYSWDGQSHVYNPFSILNLFSQQRFGEFWFATGTPTFLMKLIRSRNYGIFDVERSTMSLRALGTFDVSQIEVNSLLFQTGYLTIREMDDWAQTAKLDFPNLEVANAFSAYLLAEFAEKGNEKTDALVFRMADQLRLGAVEPFLEALKSLFAGIAYPIQPTGAGGIENHERYYHTMFYLVLRLLGYDIQVEVLTHDGRIDAVVQTQDYRYIIEFKLGDGQSAMAQIKQKGYAQQFRTDGKITFLVGIGFDVAARNLGEYVFEELD